MANNELTLTITASDKSVSQDSTPAIREKVNVVLVNIGDSTPANLVFRLLDSEDNQLAIGQSFVADGANAKGEVDLDTEELVEFFAGSTGNRVRCIKVGVWDTVDEDLLVNDRINVMNNPYTDGTSPSPSGSEYMEKEPTGGTWKVIEGQFCIWDIGDAAWRPLVCDRGAVGTGDAIDDA